VKEETDKTELGEYDSYPQYGFGFDVPATAATGSTVTVTFAEHDGGDNVFALMYDSNIGWTWNDKLYGDGWSNTWTVKEITTSDVVNAGDYIWVQLSANLVVKRITISGSVEVEDEQPSDTPATVTSSPAVTSGPAASTTPDPATDATPEPTPTPLADQDNAFLMFTDSNWAWGNWSTKVSGGFGNDAVITGDGEYSVSIDADGYAEANKDTKDFNLSAAEGANVFCVDIKNLCNSPNMDISEMEVSDLKVYADNKTIDVNTAKVLMGDVEGGGNFRIEIYNQYGDTAEDSAIAQDDLTFEKSLKVSFKLSGIKEGTSNGAFACDTDGDKKNDNYTSLKDAKDELTGAGEEDPEPLTPSATLTPVTPAETVAPSAPATTAAVTTGTSVTTPAAVATNNAVQAEGTGKLTVAKNLVVVAPGKSTTVKFTAKKAAAASKAAVVSVSTKSKKVAKVTKKGSKIKITVPKKATKGASTTVTVKSTKLNGKAISAKVTVYVRNTAKKVKPAKKSITVKKGKTVKLVLKASGKIQNKKKPVAETVTVAGKIVKLTKVQYAKKKITVTLKGNKKAKNKAVTIKVGTKKVKVKATVK
jgi:hypothetical protein